MPFQKFSFSISMICYFTITTTHTWVLLITCSQQTVFAEPLQTVTHYTIYRTAAAVQFVIGARLRYYFQFQRDMLTESGTMNAMLTGT
jgi:hypothetical protein